MFDLKKNQIKDKNNENKSIMKYFVKIKMIICNINFLKICNTHFLKICNNHFLQI